jgi:Mrp family chromosome partitioning ATPase
MEVLYRELTAQAPRAVLFDVAPVLEREDAAALLTNSDGVIVVIEQDHTHVQGLKQLQERLTKSQARVLGCVVIGGHKPAASPAPAAP